jgi:hypothetical protein
VTNDEDIFAAYILRAGGSNNYLRKLFRVKVALRYLSSS